MSQKTVLLTGGAGGIGTEICRTFAQAGYKVASTCTVLDCERISNWLSDRRSEGMDITMFETDVTDFESCKRSVAEVVEKVGPIDVLINNAGITRDKTLKKMEPEHWDAVISTNLDSVYNMTRQVIDSMLERKWGRIINISSLNGRKGQFGQSNYAAAKAGMHGFTMSIAQETARKGITVNTISPGYIATKMVLSIPEDIMKQIVGQIPVGRLGKPEEIAALCKFLASEEAGFITGANIDINGGQLIH